MRHGSYIDSPDSIKNKKATMNLTNKKDNKCFQYAITVALDHWEIGKHLEKVTKNKPFIAKYNWERINYPLEKDDYYKFNKNNLAIDINVLYAKNEIICPACISKHNSNCKNKLFFEWLKTEKDSIILQQKNYQHC